jgi:chaperone required for assembly of F1-ATPase
MKRFYKSAAVAPDGNGFAVHLDGKPLKTPARAVLALPNEALANAVAQEWRAVGETIAPGRMPLTRLAFAAADMAPAQRAAIAQQLLNFGRTDLVCYRAEAPDALIARQAAAWDPLLEWLADTHGASLTVTSGIRHVSQPREAIEALERAIGARNDYELVALHSAATATGSLTVALALLAGRIDAGAAFEAAHIDEHFQAERWGRDDAAEAGRARLKTELESAERFLKRI